MEKVDCFIYGHKAMSFILMAEAFEKFQSVFYNYFSNKNKINGLGILEDGHNTVSFHLLSPLSIVDPGFLGISRNFNFGALTSIFFFTQGQKLKM